MWQNDQYPENVTKLLRSSCQDSTWKQYSSNFKKWTEYCTINNLPVWRPSINSILAFLAKLHDDGLGYTSINSMRSCLSTMIGKVDGQNIGTHPVVCRLGVANSRPPKPKYENTWDSNLVLQFCKNLGKNSRLNIIDLSHKLVALLALTTGQRVQTLSAISVPNINFKSGSCEIVIYDKLKSSKPGSTTILSLPNFLDINLCVVKTLKCYLAKTKEIRKTDKLFISTRTPYGAVSRDTLSRWLKIVLSKSGININVYSGHSFRHSSTSKAHERGVCVDSIYKAAGWCNNSKVFAKHYRRPIINTHEFANAVLNG
ncbi:uncharacterized protein LOC118435096 isoform X3 [Folsomia candida]|uniref:uncharacterized protein LOC118435096 isoform X3 n=1 Tax=Folsomia candida TaxID=158441 RepID=UPI00160522B1|nr:uncharacterized protein LOC118435096 isoform X3 [Folsomia candida]